MATPRRRSQVTREAIAEKIDPLKLISGTMVPAMDEVGKRYEEEEYFVPELLLSARAMKGSLELLRPLLAESGAKPTGTVAIGTVKGDLHDIGKNLVASLLEGGGFEVIDLGADVPPEKFIEAIDQKGGADRLPLGPAHGDNAFHEDDHRGPEAGRRTRQGQGAGRRRAGDAAVCR